MQKDTPLSSYIDIPEPKVTETIQSHHNTSWDIMRTRRLSGMHAMPNAYMFAEVR